VDVQVLNHITKKKRLGSPILRKRGSRITINTYFTRLQ
jgi:hypothetical protein